jgi:hypothetical protein
MFTLDVPTYRIDLNRDEAVRWDEVIACEAVAARMLVDEAGAQLKPVPEIVRRLFERLYRWTGGLYSGEIESWAHGLGVSVGTVTVLNCAYELSHLRAPKIFGCSAGVRRLDGLGLVHVRCLDWPLATMGPATRLFRFHRGSREFVAVGVPGQVNILSGMMPGGYSATINWAPPFGFPTFDFGPAFLLRHTLETCDTYDAAVRMLTETPLSTSVFFTVCGTTEGQGCVIERTQTDVIVRRLTDRALVQTNHHVAERFQPNNQDIVEDHGDGELFTLAGSSRRAEHLHAALAELPPTCTLDQAVDVLNAPDVFNPDTCQQMVFHPRSGEMLLRRKTAT